MNPYQFPVTCEVCGEEAMGTIQTSAAAWQGATIYHRDPRVCADNLAYRRESMARKEKELDEREMRLREKEQNNGSLQQE